MSIIKTFFRATLWKTSQIDLPKSRRSATWYQRGVISESLDCLQNAEEFSIWEVMIPKLNGFYSIVRQQHDKLFASVDHIRSMPLFYSSYEGSFYLSDDAEWVREQVGDRRMDAFARDEFLLAGYVTGADTLYPNVKQLQAGECLSVVIKNGRLSVITKRYYRFLHDEPVSYDEAKLRFKLKEVTVASINRLITFADGRQILVPLSGGYDSRLIATLLKKLGYENIITFTYGIPGNKEADYSRQVAESLGLKWLFVEYSADLWRKEWGKEDALQYRESAGNH